MNPWERIVRPGPLASPGPNRDVDADSDVDTRSGFEDLRRSLGAALEREPGSPLLVRPSLEALLGAFVVRAQQRRGAVGLAAFELEDWKAHHERAGALGFASAFAELARELRRRVRASDELGRLGEGCIAVILPGCELPALGGVAERLRLALEARELLFGAEVVRPSIAVVSLSAAPRIGNVASARLLEELQSLFEHDSERTSG